MIELVVKVQPEERDVLLAVLDALRNDFKNHDRIDLAILHEESLLKVNIDKHIKQQTISRILVKAR